MNAQTVVNSYYIIPPATGCDGTWAIQSPSTLPNCPGPFTYSFQPNIPQFCGQMSGYSANNDTLYITLCSFPCDVTFWGMNGPCASASTGTTVNVSQLQPTVFTTYPNPVTNASGYTIVTVQPALAVQTEIYSLTGQLIFSDTQAAPDKHVLIDTSKFSAGTYVVKISVDGATPLLQKLIVL